VTDNRPVTALALTRGPAGAVLAMLDRDGEEARIVGGAVRNVLLGVPLGDIDIATTALPDEVIRRTTAVGFRPVATGIEHGTVTVVADGVPFEVTTLRQDIETYGRRAKVVFGRDWRLDAQRRDFTINALFLSRDGAIHDYVGGRADLAAHRVRFIGDPAARIAEDYLRILRFFRFHASYGEGAPDQAGLAAGIRARERIASLSRERVRMELIKLLTAPRAGPTLAIMTEAGILGPVLGGVPLLGSFVRMEAIEAASGLAPDACRRLGALAVLILEDAERLSERLRLSNAETERLASMAQVWWRLPAAADNERALRALLYRLGEERFVDRMTLAWSRTLSDASDPVWRRAVSLPQRWEAPTFPLKAADLIVRGVAKGPALGQALAAAEEAWVAADFPREASTLAAIADAAVGSNP
jgi:poly(A) polymerase